MSILDNLRLRLSVICIEVLLWGLKIGKVLQCYTGGHITYCRGNEIPCLPT